MSWGCLGRRCGRRCGRLGGGREESKGFRVKVNREAGWLLRTKGVGSEEGGVAAGIRGKAEDECDGGGYFVADHGGGVGGEGRRRCGFVCGVGSIGGMRDEDEGCLSFILLEVYQHGIIGSP